MDLVELDDGGLCEGDVSRSMTSRSRRDELVLLVLGDGLEDIIAGYIAYHVWV